MVATDSWNPIGDVFQRFPFAKWLYVAYFYENKIDKCVGKKTLLECAKRGTKLTNLYK